MYQVLDALLVRAAAHAADPSVPPWPPLTGGPDDAERCRGWLLRVWSLDGFAAAVTIASPALAAQARRACDEQVNDLRRLRRLVFSVARYLLRATGRSTPFGLFAGVAPARFDTKPAARWGDRYRAVVRADAAWLAPMIDRLEAWLPLLRRLPVVANNLASLRGERLRLPFREQPGSYRAGQTVLGDVSVRYTRAAESALRHASSPIELSKLVERLAAEFPATAASVIEAMLADLVGRGILVTGLRPPMTSTDGLGHVVNVLRDVDAEAIPEITEQVRALYAVFDEITVQNRQSTVGTDQWIRLTERMQVVNAAAELPIMVDLQLDLEVRLPAVLRRELAAAATALTRLTPEPSGMGPWREFHAAFLERYGVGAMIPLAELINPDAGLGFPATYRGSERTAPTEPLTGRDRQLLALVQAATIAGRDEIVLDDETIADLVGEVPGGQQVPPHIELFIQVRADSIDALQRRAFTLVVTGASRAAGTTTGRFLYLFDRPTRRRFRDAYTSVPSLRAGAVPAQVSGPPLRAQSHNVAHVPATFARTIPLGEQPGIGALRLSDLAVGGDADGLFLVSIAERRLIEPTALNAVEFRHFSHPLARFLCEISRARAAVYSPFSWGAASSLPWLPRLRYGRTVLAAVRWNLPATDLPPRRASSSQWQDAFGQWRRQYRLPRHVDLVEGDNLLPLDLDEPLHLMLLRSHLVRYERARLDEAPPAGAFGWIGGHSHEIVAPLAATVDPLPSPAHLPNDAHLRYEAYERGRIGEVHLPGVSPWLFVKLYAHTGTQTDILTDLAGFLSGWEPPIEWWYVPYRDPQPHLRIRLRMNRSDDYGPVAQRLGTWAERLRERGLFGRMQLDTYHPENGRYGTGPAMAAAERVFAADSAAALAQRTTATDHMRVAEAITVASLVDLTTGFVGGTGTGMHWLIEQLPHEPGPVDRTLHASAMRVADPCDNWVAIREIPGGDEVVATWARRRQALADYRRLLAAQRDPLPVAASLLHMHHVRMFGIDPDRERTGRRLARAAAARWLATHPGSGP